MLTSKTTFAGVVAVASWAEMSVHDSRMKRASLPAQSVSFSMVAKIAWMRSGAERERFTSACGVAVPACRHIWELAPLYF